jgi:hypothetical protein
MVAFRTSIRQRGFSEKATKRISGAVRQSTGEIYDSKWVNLLFLVGDPGTKIVLAKPELYE